jgi:predicted XRE-type DNA-binding protein
VRIRTGGLELPQTKRKIYMINRAAILLKLKQPAIDWINEVDPVDNHRVNLKSANEDRTVYLVDDEVADDADIAKRLKTTQPRVSAMRKRKINDFRLDMLIDFASRPGLRVSIDVAA